MGYLGTEAGHAAEDPPRPDFRTSTRARRRKLPLDKLGDSPLERQTALFAEAAGFSAAYLAAFVRAVERSQMAEELRARDAITQRLLEADVYAHRAAASLEQTSEQNLALAQALEDDDQLREAARDRFRGPTGRALIETPFWEKVPPEILRLFREARLDPKSLAPYWDNEFPEDPISSSVDTLRLAADSSGTLAVGLEHWGPAPEKPGTPTFIDVS
jgi:hypothetical protein